MNTIASAARLIRCVIAVFVLVLGCSVVRAQEKKSNAAPAKAAPAAKPSGASAAKSGGSAAGHGPTTSTAGHGPTTSTASHGPTTAGHGPTTTTAGHGPTTAGHGATTSTAGHGPAAAGHGAAVGSAGHGAGGANHTAMAGGREPAGSHTVHTANGNEIRTRANGRPADVHVANRGMDIHHGLSGGRRVSVERADHSRIVADRRGHGYVQHPYMYHGHEFAHRTYYRDGRAYDRFYRRYPYRGVYVEAYAPAVYYRPAFYGWVYNPWAVPVTYAWGFAAAPWYGFYGVYFAPYPVYPTASLWLTDYLISQSLAAAYQDQLAAAQAQAAANAAAAPPAPLSPEVKQEIADEVQRQIALENQEAQMNAQNQEPDPASSGIQRMMSDGVQHVFVAGANIDVTDNGGTECSVGEGDALQLTGPPAPDATAATLVMLSSKGGVECPKGDTVSVSFSDLQDMQNHMRETISAGMGNLQTNQGKGGLPAVPASANAAPVKAEFASTAPPPDNDAANEINQQAQGADQAEKDALSDAPSAQPAADAAPKSIEVGQTTDQVVAALGQPKSIVNLGAKKIYVYQDLKVTFKDGKVSDVQ